MTHILFRPHVAGGENQITTPDVVIDRLAIECDGTSHYMPVQRVTTRVDVQALPGDLTLVPGYALIAAGGGVLVGLAALVHGRDDRPATADVLLARSAWRLRSLAPHFRSLEMSFDTDGSSLNALDRDPHVRESLEMSFDAGGSSRRVRISELAQPSDLLSRANGGELVLPRGVAIVCCATALARTIRAPITFTNRLSDETLGRHLAHSVELRSVDDEPWPERPLPRYAVGPVGEVKHYI